jgi:WD40 repeat protein
MGWVISDLGLGEGHAGWDHNEFGVEAIALSPDGKTAATGNIDGAVKLWNIETGKDVKDWTGYT